MKSHFVLILIASTVLTINQNNQQPKLPPDLPCDSVKADKKPISGGILNGKVVSGGQLAYPQKALENHIEGAVVIQVVFNEDGEVITAEPTCGPEQLWAASVKAAVTSRFQPTKLSGQPIKVKGVLRFHFENGKAEMPKPTGSKAVTDIASPRP